MPRPARNAGAPSVPLGRPAVAALAGGLAWGFAHGIETRPWLAAVAIAPLLVALGTGRGAFRLGWLFGTAAWLVAIPWIVPTLTTYGHLAGWLAGLALLLLAGFLGLYEALFAALGARLWRRGDPLSLAALPALWVALELARGWLFGGFPWNLAAYAWTDLPGALPLSAWIGAWGVSYLLVLANVGVARGFALRAWAPALLGLLVPATLLALGARFAAGGGPGAELRPVAVVQPNIPNRPWYDAEASAADYHRLHATTRTACRPGTLVLWPESAAWPRQWQDDPSLRIDLRELVRAGGCALLLNSAVEEGGRVYNSVVLLSSAGESDPSPAEWVGRLRAGTEGVRVQRADKRHLVPFGEYVPLRTLLPFLGTIARMAGDFSPASSIVLLEWGEARMGAAVCYEVVFPGETAALARAGADLLLTVTNDAWYGDSAAPRQHFRAARFRAAENRRWLLRAAITGISAVVRADGSLAAVADVGETTVLRALVPTRDDRAPFTRAPWLVPAAAVALAALASARERISSSRAAPPS